MIDFIKGLSLAKQIIIGSILILILGIVSLNWYTNIKVKGAFKDFSNKQTELIKGDKDAVNKVDDGLGAGSILDGLLGAEDTSNGQERSWFNSSQIPDTNSQSTNDAGVHTDSRERIEATMFNSGVAEQPEESDADSTLLYYGCAAVMPIQCVYALCECIEGEWIW